MRGGSGSVIAVGGSGESKPMIAWERFSPEYALEN